MIHEYVPRGRLAPFIDVFWLTEDTSRAGRMERVLPTGTMQIISNLHDDPLRGNGRQTESIKTVVVAG